jgi:Leucine-rich repeat (LRR) protein
MDIQKRDENQIFRLLEKLMETTKELLGASVRNVTRLCLEGGRALRALVQDRHANLAGSPDVERNSNSETPELEEIPASFEAVFGQNTGDWSFLLHRSNLQHVVVSMTNFSNLAVLQNCTNLRRLEICGTQVVTLEGIQALPQLQYLFASALHSCVDFSALQHLNEIQYLDVSDGNFADLNHLVNLRELVCLDITDTKVVDLSPLSILESLIVVEFNGRTAMVNTPRVQWTEVF